MRLVGINVNTDREFGLALLRFLAEELRRRADAAKRHEVTKLAELRAEDPDRALAADRRGGRRVPGAAGRPGRGRPARPPTCWRTWPGGAARRASTWCWPRQDVSRHRGAVGAAGAGRPVHAADRAAQGAADPGRDATTPPSRCPGTTRWSTPSPALAEGEPGGPDPVGQRLGDAGASCSTGCGGCARRTPRRARLFDGDAIPRLADAPTSGR